MFKCNWQSARQVAIGLHNKVGKNFHWPEADDGELSMLNLNDILLFTQIVERGGFTAASQVLGIPKSTLSIRVIKLETSLGVRLLNRSTRHIAMTAAGRDFYHHALAMLREAEMAETVARQHLAEPSGLVRCTVGIATMQFAMSEIIAQFLLKYPKVDVFSHATDRAVDIVGENFDVAVRAHSDPLPDSNLVQRKLVTIEWHLFAGSAYLAAHGEPTTPRELPAHSVILMNRSGAPMEWHLRHVDKTMDEVVIPLAPRLVSEDVSGLQKAAIMGLGVIALPSYICREAVQAGTLRRILPDWTAGVGHLTTLIPCRQGVLPSVRAFLDHLAEEVPKLALPLPIVPCRGPLAS